MEDENNFLHRGESVAAYLFYCGRAKVWVSNHFYKWVGEGGIFGLSFPLSTWTGARGSVVVKALCYKPEGRGFDARWGEFLNLTNPSGRTRPWG
jgi:hypothetical protein